jgi:hypothetical protein
MLTLKLQACLPACTGSRTFKVPEHLNNAKTG